MEIAIYKKPDDVSLGIKVLRISIGGPVGGDKAYITYRGNLEEVQWLLQLAAKALSEVKEEPPISPNDGKQFA